MRTPHVTAALVPTLFMLALTGPVAWAAGSRPAGNLSTVPAPDAVVVPAGPFTMGNDSGTRHANRDEAPAHRPHLDHYTIDRHEVTNGQYRDCVKRGSCTPPGAKGSKTRGGYFRDPGYSNHPVINVDWYQAQAYCRWKGGRLPTEAEWEKAARGDKDRRQYPWGDRRPDCTLANFGGPDGCQGDTDRVGARPAGKSPYGAHDMAGNVWEWVSDWYDPSYYKRSSSKNPRGPRWGAFKVMRGGCYDTGPKGLRVSCRNRDMPTSRKHNVGFRCARSSR